MKFEKIATDASINEERLRGFDIRDQHQDGFGRISEILRPHAVQLATVYLDNFLAAADIHVDEATRIAQIGKAADYSSRKYTPPIDADWIARIEKRGEIQFKLRAPIRAHLGALSRSHRLAAEIIFRDARDPTEGRALVGQFMRVAALEVEIMVSTMQRLERDAHRESIRKSARTFESSIASIIQSATTESTAVRSKSERVAVSADALLALSGDVAAAAEQSTLSMSKAAKMSGGLNRTVAAISGELSDAFVSFAELTETADRARASSEQLKSHTRSIDQIVNLIGSIADRTKILALNALIQASGSGQAVTGFSVVANEMKSLATQTENAAKEIGVQLSEIVKTSERSANDYSIMGERFARLQVTAGELRTALEEQFSNTASIADCIDETAQGARSAAAAVGEINHRVEQVSVDMADVKNGVDELDGRLSDLERSAKEFLISLNE